MSEADSTPRRRPPTIDLTAKEVETAAPESPPEADAGQAPNHAGRCAGRAVRLIQRSRHAVRRLAS